MAIFNRPYSGITIIFISCILSFWILKSWTSRAPYTPFKISPAVVSKPDPGPLSKVWQIFLDPVDHDPSIPHMDAIKASHIPLELTGSWFPVDGGWDYHFLGTDRADAFVHEHFSKYPDIVKVFTELRRPVVRGDLMRYLAVCAEGGVFSDYDTLLKKPLQQWVPEQYRAATKAVIGIEFDRRDGPEGVKRASGVTFVQYTFAATAWHPIMFNMVQNVTATILARAQAQGVSVSDLDFDDDTVLTVSGPEAFTQIVYDHLSQQAGRTISWKDLTMLHEAKSIGDTLILTINGFGAGQVHSGSNDSSPDVLVRHMFNGGWRGGKDKLSGHVEHD